MKQRHALFVRLHIFKTPTWHKVHHASKHFWTVNDNVRLNKRNIFGLFCLLDLRTSCPAQEKVQNLCFNSVFVNDICQRPWRCPRVACDFTIIVLLMARAVSFKSPSRIRLNIHCVTVTPHFLPVLITLRRCGELFEKVRASEIKSGEHTRKGLWEMCCHRKGKYSKYEMFPTTCGGGCTIISQSIIEAQVLTLSRVRMHMNPNNLAYGAQILIAFFLHTQTHRNSWF